MIRKRRGPPRKNPKVALVLAGGAVSGGAFKVGGLKALNDFLAGRRITELDIYVGLSAGSVLAVPLAAGISPDEMVKVLEGTSRRFNQLRPMDFYQPNVREFAERPARLAYELLSYWPAAALDFARQAPHLPKAMRSAAVRFWRQPDYTNFERLAMRFLEQTLPSRELPSPTDHIPSGIFDSVGLEKWLRINLERIRIPNDFRGFEKRTGRSLYITACDLDTAERAVFGSDEVCDVSISQAVQASTALPGFYKPARIGGVDYVDGGVRNTANIDLAIEKGADLVICYNPFRPFLNRLEGEDGETSFASGRHLADRGFKLVINQVFRTLLHSRLKLGLQRYVTDDRFEGDIVLLEPAEEDANFFAMNPLAFWKRADALRHGFESVRTTVLQNFDDLSEVLGAYGLEMSQSAAQRRAARVRKTRGWGEALFEESEEPDEVELRLVGS
jgi:predicted acylesterase/phospholipase RssA